MRILRRVFTLLVMMLMAIPEAYGQGTDSTGSVIFIHPDGSGAGMWTAMRLLSAGPDGMTHWDSLSHMGLYRSHQRNSLSTTSHAGATVHAYGVKVDRDTYGSVASKPVRSPSPGGTSIMIEARDRGRSVGVINSGHLCEPGTGVFLSSAFSRYAYDSLSAQIIESGADVILGGGENLLLPEGSTGRHGGAGRRRDGRNLVEEALRRGYRVVYTREEMLALPDNVELVLGVFAAWHTFNDRTEEDLRERELPLYGATAPSVGEMTAFALRMLHAKERPFLLVVEEEGTDNFANRNNAAGAIEALRRADEAIGVARRYVDAHERALLLTAADSDAGGMGVWCDFEHDGDTVKVPLMDGNGSPLDGATGSGTRPFFAKADASGRCMPFAIAWASGEDLSGAVIARAHGWNAGRLPLNVDNTKIYELMRLTLFGPLP